MKTALGHTAATSTKAVQTSSPKDTQKHGDDPEKKAPQKKAPNSHDEDKAIEAYNLAVVAFNNGRLDEALKHLTQAIHWMPDFPQAYRMRCDVYLSQGKHKDAVADADKAVALDPKDPQAYLLRAQANVGWGKTGDAVEDLFKVLQLQPGNEQARRNYFALALGPFQDLIPLSSSGKPKESPSPSLEQLLLPSLPGSPAAVHQPLGRLNINVLHYAIVDAGTGTLTLIGDYDPQWPTGPIPYLELLQAAWKEPEPWVNLQPEDKEVERIRQVFSKTWVQDTLRSACAHPDDWRMTLLLQANCGWAPGEARVRAQRLLGQAGSAAQVEELRAFSKRQETFHKEGFWFPPSFMEKFGKVDLQIPVQFGAAVEDSQMARILFQADYCLKHATEWVPLERLIPGYVTFAHHCRKQVAGGSGDLELFRWALKPEKVALLVNEAGPKTIVGFPETQLRLEGGPLAGKSSIPSAAFSAYAKLWTERYDALARWFPALHELREAVKVHALVNFLRQQKVKMEFPEQTWTAWKKPAVVPAPLFAMLYPASLEKYSFEPQGGISLQGLGQHVQMTRDTSNQIPLLIRKFAVPAITPGIVHLPPITPRQVSVKHPMRAGTFPHRIDGPVAKQLQTPDTGLQISFLSRGEGSTVNGLTFPNASAAEGTFNFSFLERKADGTLNMFSGKWTAAAGAKVEEASGYFRQEWEFTVNAPGFSGIARATIRGIGTEAAGEASGWQVTTDGRNIKMKFGVQFSGNLVRLLVFQEDVSPGQ
jgi:tetratricopeptide (TPR) repeat protein